MKSSENFTNREIAGNYHEEAKQKAVRQKISAILEEHTKDAAIGQMKRKVKKKDRVEEILQEVLAGKGIPEGYEITSGGVKSEAYKGFISDCPFWVSHHTAEMDNKGRTLAIEGITSEHRLIRLEIPFSLIHTIPGQLAATLSSAGLRVRTGAAKEVANYINTFVDVPLLIRVHQPGWLGDPNEKLVFALRDYVVGGDGFDLSRLKEARLLAGMASSGTLEEWIEHVAAPADSHPVVAVSIMVPFASVLLRLLDAEGFGLMLRGSSSTGKSTALMMMASVFGRAVLGPNSFILSFNATTNAVEATCVSRNDVGMPLDELGAFDGPGFTTLVYRIPGGVGKGRLGRDGSLRESQSWRTILLGTSERRVDELLAEDARAGRVRAGQSVRLMNIETGGRIFVCDSVAEAKAEVHKLRSAVAKYYGTAGPAFVERLIEKLNDPDEPDFTIQELRNEWEALAEALMVPDLEPHQQRAIRQLGIIALGGTVACLLGILPYDNADVLEYVKEMRDMYLASGTSSDGMRALRRLRDYLIDHSARFVNIRLAHRANAGTRGYFWEVQGVKYYLFSTKGILDAAGVTGLSELLPVLGKYNLIHRNNGPGKYQAKVPVAQDPYSDCDKGRPQTSMYCISEHLMSWTDDQPYPTRATTLDDFPRVTRKVKQIHRRREDIED